MNSDLDLIIKVKKSSDSAALVELVNRHTGIYNSIVNQYYNSGINIPDLMDERMINMYMMAMKYEPDHGMKFSTFVGERTRFICQKEMKKYSKNHGGFDAGDGYTNDEEKPLARQQDVVVDTSSMMNQIEMNDLSKYIDGEVKDERALRIIAMRHSSPPATWRECGAALGITYERARQIYEEFCGEIKKELENEVK